LTGNACPEVVHAQTDANPERDYVSLVFRNGVGSGNEEWRITAIANPLRSGPGSQGVDGEGPVDIVR